MSQFRSDDFRQSRRVVVRAETRGRTAGTGPLLLSLLFFVPIAPLLGLFSGLASFRSSGGNGDAVSGRSLRAVCAVVLGGLFTIVQAYAGYRGLDFYREMTRGPGEALASGFSGNAAGFAGHFATATPDDAVRAAVFIEDLRTRFGDFQSANIRERSAGESPLGPRMYELMFENAIVRAEIATAFDVDWLKSKLSYIAVWDPTGGQITFPSDRAIPSPREDRHAQADRH